MHHSNRMIFSAALLAAAILFVGPAQAEEKYLPPAPPPPNFVAATANLVVHPPVVPTVPTRLPASAVDQKLPQYDTGPIIAPPAPKVGVPKDEMPKSKPVVKQLKSDSDTNTKPASEKKTDSHSKDQPTE